MQDKHSRSRSRSLFLDSLSLFPWKNYYYYYYYYNLTLQRLRLYPCTVLLKKNYLNRLRTNGREKATDKNRGDATIFPYFSSKDTKRKPGVEGGGKWTYEATFGIAMKIGRKYPSTAAQQFHYC